VRSDVALGPAHWQRFSTTNADQAHEFFRQAFIDFHVRSSAPGDDRLVLRTAGAELGDVSMVRMRYSSGSLVRTEPGDDINIDLIFAGRFSLNDGKDSYAVPHPGAVLIPADRAVGVFFENIDVVTVRLPRALMAQTAQQIAGIESADLRFDTGRPVSPAMDRHWRQTVSYVMGGVLADPDLCSNPLITGPARRLLAATALTVFPTNARTDEHARPGQVAPAVLRRAETYIEEHAGQDMTVTEIAAASGCSVRALQSGFRRYRDTTPLQYARTVRLRQAHRDLQNADPTDGTTVAAVAARWGFANPGRFSGDYRTAYGHNPAHTLRT
jgi:AraC-like DNA-binding protein